MFALYTALSAGLLGAFFSRLITVQRQWGSMTLDEVFQHREWSYTLLRAGVGVCGRSSSTSSFVPESPKVRYFRCSTTSGSNSSISMTMDRCRWLS